MRVRDTEREKVATSRSYVRIAGLQCTLTRVNCTYNWSFSIFTKITPFFHYITRLPSGLRFFSVSSFLINWKKKADFKTRQVAISSNVVTRS